MLYKSLSLTFVLSLKSAKRSRVGSNLHLESTRRYPSSRSRCIQKDLNRGAELMAEIDVKVKTLPVG